MSIHFHCDFNPKGRSVQHPSVCLKNVFVCRRGDILDTGQSGETLFHGQFTSAGRDVFVISVRIDDVIDAGVKAGGVPTFKIRSLECMLQHSEAGKIPHLHVIAKSDDIKRLIDCSAPSSGALLQTIGADASSIKLARAIVLSFDGASCRNRLFVENAAMALLLNLIARWSPLCINGHAQPSGGISANHQ